MSWDDEDKDKAKLLEAEHKKVALENAQLYLVFTQDARAKALFEQWEKTSHLLTPPTASHAQFAYAEGQRAFVRGIRQQLEFLRENA